MDWMLVSDSSCDIRELEDLALDVQFAIVPFKIRIGEREYVDLPTLNVQQMLDAMTAYSGGSSTACPSPEEWAERFLQADNILAFTISHNLSGSYNAALAAREMVLEEYPEKNIFIVDSLSTGGTMANCIYYANDLIRQGYSYEAVCNRVAECAVSGGIAFVLASFENLAKAGRVSKVVGFIAGRLNMRVLGRRTPDGKVDFYFKTRGETRALARILEQMDEDGFDGSRPVFISHCNNMNACKLLEHGIHTKWPNAVLRVHPCAGLCSYYAQDQGIIVCY